MRWLRWKIDSQRLHVATAGIFSRKGCETFVSCYSCKLKVTIVTQTVWNPALSDQTLLFEISLFVPITVMSVSLTLLIFCSEERIFSPILRLICWNSRTLRLRSYYHAQPLCRPSVIWSEILLFTFFVQLYNTYLLSYAKKYKYELKEKEDDWTQSKEESTFVLSSSSVSRSSTGRWAIEWQPGTGSISSSAPSVRANLKY